MKSEAIASPPSLRLTGVQRGSPFQVELDGKLVEGYAGESVAAVIIACGQRVFLHTQDGSPRGYSCGIGRCFSCLVTIDGVPNQRACITTARPGMIIRTGSAEGGPR